MPGVGMESLTGEDPRSIGGYEVRARLGAGGFGQVYLGLSPGGRTVAIKVLRPELREDREFLRRFRLEVAAARQVNGFYTAQVVAAGLDDRRPWVATAFVPGPPLDRAVVANGPLPEPALWRLLAGLVEALQEIHGCGLVHRDLKPANVLLAADGPRVIDFGISKVIDGTAMTSAGVVMGTPSFMAPEQAEGKAVSPESDVFSLGSVLAYAATGRPPFGRDGYASVLYRIVHGDPMLDGVPPQLRAVIEWCLAKAPAARARLTELAGIGRDGPLAAPAPSALAFWPPGLAQLIREYQGQLDTAELADAQQRSATATATVSSALPASGSLGRGARIATTLPQPRSRAPATIFAEQQDRYPQAGYAQESNPTGYDRSSGDRVLNRCRGRRWLAWAASGTVALVVVVVVAITLNRGSSIPVPGLSGKTQAQAVAAIDAAGLKPAVIKKADAHVRSGLVISSNPTPGSALGKGQTVTLYLSTGVANITLPDFRGTSSTAAQAALRKLGFTNVRLVADPESAIPAGEVDHTAPTPGSYPRSQQVVLYVSDAIQVPNVLSQTGLEASAILQQDGFSVAEISTPAPADQMVEPGTVYNQNPASSTAEPRGTRIQIFVQPQTTATATTGSGGGLGGL